MDKAEKILRNSLKSKIGDSPASAALEEGMGIINAKRALSVLENLTRRPICEIDSGSLRIFADEVAKCLGKIKEYFPLTDSDDMEYVSGKGVEFEYAARDISYLNLGKEVGDCTSSKTPLQVDRNVENIYWTVFSYVLDRNYQILKVLYDKDFIMKVHILPLYVRKDDYCILAVDAIETVRAFRDDVRGKREELLEKKEHIFGLAIEKVRQIAGRMGISRIYAVRFSNTPWVRRKLCRLNSIYLPIKDIIKLDELEDVLELAKEICKEEKAEVPGEIFMELQARNVRLLPEQRRADINEFGIVQGSLEGGIPMKQVVGV